MRLIIEIDVPDEAKDLAIPFVDKMLREAGQEARGIGTNLPLRGNQNPKFETVAPRDPNTRRYDWFRLAAAVRNATVRRDLPA